VNPALDIVLKCPNGILNERIENFLKKKWFWLEKQLSFFKKYQRKIYKKEYISGEGFLYLGKQYKLLVKKSDEDKVSITKGLLMVYTTKNVLDGKYTKKLISKWYNERIDQVFYERYEQIGSKFECKVMPKLVIRGMQRRWGSFLNNGIIILNPRLVHAPKECIDYVITHELCHTKYKNHDKNFYKLLKKQCPKWEKIKDRLETIGSYSKL